MPESFYLSDTHLFHPKVAEYRGFSTVSEHNAAIMDSLHKLPAGSDLHLCGDLSSGSTGSEDSALELLATLTHLTLHLKPGNHDSVHPMHKNSHRRHAKFRAVFTSIELFSQVRLAGHRILVDHFPYTRDRGQPRYMQWRLPDHGLYLIHGHTHSDERFHGREINVAWEAWQRPISGHEIAQYIARRESA